MVGAVGVALAIEYDRSGVFTFLVPGAIGILLLVGAWVSCIHRMSRNYFLQISLDDCVHCEFLSSFLFILVSFFTSQRYFTSRMRFKCLLNGSVRYDL